MQDNYKSVFFDRLYELNSLYARVKYAVILMENFDRNREMYVAPINQLRSALDHVFKAISCAQDDEPRSTYELKEAKEHLNYAGCDALELLAGSLGTSIIEKISKYKTSTLSVVFPEYYKVIKPELLNIKETIAVQRLEKESDKEKLFLIYYDQITKMVEMDKNINAIIPSLENYEERLRWKNKLPSIMQAIFSIIGAVIGGVLVYVFTSFL